MKTIDCRGLSCPQPVIETKKVLEGMKEGIIEVIVDNVAAKENVSRFASNQGCQVESVEEGRNFHLTITKGDVKRDAEPIKTSDLKKEEVLLITADQIGMGSEELGRTLMKAFINTLIEIAPKPGMIIFMNSAVKLAIEGSPVLESLVKLEKVGVNLLVCGTCLNYFEVKDKLKAGKVSNMYEIAEQMFRAEKVVSP
jgi:tRNA 2-thiouridine synthesizing protein A